MTYQLRNCAYAAFSPEYCSCHPHSRAPATAPFRPWRGLYERQDALRLGLLAALSGESVFLLGPPGIAKSLIARRLKLAFQDARHFEYLMTRFSTPEEVFGPLSIQALKEDGKYLRLTSGYLPEAEVVFLDEIWKAGPAILNTCSPPSTSGSFATATASTPFPCGCWSPPRTSCRPGQRAGGALRPHAGAGLDGQGAGEIQLPGHAGERWPIPSEPDPSVQIRGKSTTPGRMPSSRCACRTPVSSSSTSCASSSTASSGTAAISDRRWKKAVRLIKASAFFNGRDEVAPLDLLLFKDCLWHDEASRTALLEMIGEFSRLYGYQQLALTRELLSCASSSSGAGGGRPAHRLQGGQAQAVVQAPRPRQNSAGQRQAVRQAGALPAAHPAPLDGSDPERLTGTLTFDRTLLSTGTPPGSAGGLAPRQPQGGHYELVLDEQLRLHVLDIQRQPVPLMLVERTPIPEVVMAPWLSALDDLTGQVNRVLQNLKGQRNLFDRHQPHLFVGDHWLRQVEDSFFVLSRDLERLGAELQQWRDRLPLLDAQG
jgi:MoxR-like ATPase